MPHFLILGDIYLVVKWCAPFTIKASANINTGIFHVGMTGTKTNIIAKSANINCNAPRVFLSMYVPPWKNDNFVL